MANVTKEKKNTTKLARPVAGYDPTDKMTEIHNDPNQPDKFNLYLEVGHRVDWFHLWCAENGTVGFIDDTNVTYDQTSVPGFVLARCDCTVNVNGEVIGCGMATRPFLNNQDPAYYRDFVQGLCTTAKGRALANAGFNVPGGATAEDGQMQSVQTTPIMPAAASQGASVTEAPKPPQMDFSQLPWMVQGNTPTATAETNAAAAQKSHASVKNQAQKETPEQAANPVEELSPEEALNCPVTGIRALGDSFTVGSLLKAEACADTKDVSGRDWLEYLAGRGKKPSPIQKKNPKLFSAANLALDM